MIGDEETFPEKAIKLIDDFPGGMFLQVWLVCVCLYVFVCVCVSSSYSAVKKCCLWTQDKCNELN